MTAVAARPGFPLRHRAGEGRARRMGRPLRYLAGVQELDEALMDRIGRGFLERDEVGARLADAIRLRAGAPGRVTMAQFRTALDRGVAAVPDAPAALVDFFDAVTTVPDWVDWGRVEHGAAMNRRLGQNAADVLLQLSLVGGYRFGGPTDLLAATGALTGDRTLQRLAETQQWAVSVARPVALRPGAEGWRQTVQVRLMHAMVNAAFEERWDVDRWGYPINQTDLAGTLGLFDATLLIGARALGVRIPRSRAEAVMHQWKWIGHLLGVHPDFLVDGERAKYRLLYHVLRAQAGISPAGPELAQAVVAAQRRRRYPGWPRPLQRVRSACERERLLSMLTVFLGPGSMRELGLPARPPWAFAYLWPLNLLRYVVLARLPGGGRRLEDWGERVSDRILASYVPDEGPGPGGPPGPRAASRVPRAPRP